MEEFEEKWEYTNNTSTSSNTIVKIYNTGWIERKDGRQEQSKYNQNIKINGKCRKIYRFIAEHFIPKTDEDIALGRNQIDHKTHNPIGMNINDVRNLRWCTKKENNNFDEGRENKRKARINKPTSEFGRKYYDHYGYSMSENKKQYNTELQYYRHHNGRCRWE